MCLGIPMRLVRADGPSGEVELGGVRRAVRLDLLPSARPGDWVLIHAGYAVAPVDPEAAAETLALLGGEEEVRGGGP